MPNDPLGLTPDPAADDPQSPDYLGRMVPLAFKGQPALPVTGAAAVGAPGGPVGPGSPGAPAGMGGGDRTGQPTAFLDLARRLLEGGKDLSRLFPGYGDLGTRGDTGGVSLSDYLRTIEGGGADFAPIYSGGTVAGEAALGQDVLALGQGAPLQALQGLEAAAAAGETAAETGMIAGTTAGQTAAEAGLSGVLAGAGAAFAPIALTQLIATLFGSDMNISDMWTGQKPTDYQKFMSKLQFGEGQQGQGLSILAQALPYVQSKEELGQLLNTYRNYVSTTQTAPMTPAANPYQLTTIPGMTGREHGGKGPAVDWAEPTARLQSLIDRYKAVLPGEEITKWYGEEGGGLTGADAMRLWTQFTDLEHGGAPFYQPTDAPTYTIQVGEGETTIPAVAKGFYGERPTTEALAWGQPGYDYADSGGFPEPGQTLGERNPLWDSLFDGRPGVLQAVGPSFGEVADRAMPPDAIPGVAIVNEGQAMSPGGGGEQHGAQQLTGLEGSPLITDAFGPVSITAA